MKHTPTPWHFKEGYVVDGNENKLDVRDYEEHIIKCVNAHEEHKNCTCGKVCECTTVKAMKYNHKYNYCPWCGSKIKE